MTTNPPSQLEIFIPGQVITCWLCFRYFHQLENTPSKCEFKAEQLLFPLDPSHGEHMAVTTHCHLLQHTHRGLWRLGSHRYLYKIN